jgi:thiol-disulfide isomerase/thioredoxin
MLNRFALLILILALSVLYAHVKKKELDANLVEVEANLLASLPLIEFQSYPDLKIITSHELSSNQEQKHFYHFWGTWCPPCIGEFPELLRFIDRNKDKPVKFYLVAVNDKVELIEKFLKPYQKFLNDKIVILIDNSGQYNEAFGAAKVPETFIFNGDLSISRRLQGPQDWQLGQYDQLFQSK